MALLLSVICVLSVIYAGLWHCRFRLCFCLPLTHRPSPRRSWTATWHCPRHLNCELVRCSLTMRCSARTTQMSRGSLSKHWIFQATTTAAMRRRTGWRKSRECGESRTLLTKGWKAHHSKPVFLQRGRRIRMLWADCLTRRREKWALTPTQSQTTQTKQHRQRLVSAAGAATAAGVVQPWPRRPCPLAL